MTWLLILYAEFVVMVVIILPSPYPVYSTINMVIFNMLAFLAYASHIRTMFSDPVSVEINAFKSLIWLQCDLNNGVDVLCFVFIRFTYVV